MHTLIYARYSSSLQNPRSIADQLAACRARCEAEGWPIAGEFTDAAISGAAGIDDTQRPGLAALLARLEKGDVHQVLTESTDRIARHQGDAFAVRELIEHHGARLFTLMDGAVDEITGTIKGLMDSRMRKDLAQRVRRGHTGNIREGRAASGVAYGYRKVTDRLDVKGHQVNGLREIDPDKAAIVLRIFSEYAAGASPREIAARLNAEGIPAPRGRIWRASTLAGHRREGIGMLSNPIYIGRLIYGRTRSAVDPRSRRRSTVAAQGTTTSSEELPHLRLIDDTLWRQVQAQLEARAGGPPERQRRPKHILSGLAKCGCCGASWIITRNDYMGCSSAFDRACDNRRLIRRDQLETRVIDQLKAEMLAPEVVAAYLEEYRAEHARQARDAGQQRHQLERKRADAARKVANLVEFIAEGDGGPELRERLAKARADQAAAEKALASAAALPELVIHPGLARQYKAAIDNLALELAEESTRQEAAPRLRALIARVELTPSEGTRGVEIAVIRHIDEVLTLTRRTA